jgi:ubiquinone/menaquinone biosynthesis C-methylase UbiE
MSIYQVLANNPERACRFSNNMKAYMLMQEYNVSHVVSDYDWESLGPVQLVDVGGGAGHITMELAKHFPKLSITVQDMEKMIEQEWSNVPAELAERFKFMVHDMFTPQTIQADVYFFRWVFHNWSDKYSALIIKALIPALKPGAKIILNEACMPDPGTISHWREKYLR